MMSDPTVVTDSHKMMVVRTLRNALGSESLICSKIRMAKETVTKVYSNDSNNLDAGTKILPTSERWRAVACCYNYFINAL
jgi:hypothetical protein